MDQRVKQLFLWLGNNGSGVGIKKKRMSVNMTDVFSIHL
jgi:hypothetical protein